MNLQEACEEMEAFLEEDRKAINPKLSIKRFMALNQILLELNLDGKYEIPEMYYDK